MLSLLMALSDLQKVISAGNVSSLGISRNTAVSPTKLITKIQSQPLFLTLAITWTAVI